MGGEKDWKINGKAFSISGLSEIVESLDPSDELKFEFSGEDYKALKKHIESYAGSESGDRYEVSRIIDVSNKENKLNQRCTVCIKRIHL